MPWASGVKSAVSGLKGAVSVRCRPIAALPAFFNASISACVQLGATTITDVAFSRPRATRSRIAAFTPGAMP